MSCGSAKRHDNFVHVIVFYDMTEDFGSRKLGLLPHARIFVRRLVALTCGRCGMDLARRISRARSGHGDDCNPSYLRHEHL